MAKPPDDDLRQAVALFRYGLIADLVNLPPGTPGIGARLRAKAGRDYDIPGTDRTRVAAETLRDWVRLYRRGGFDALHPRPRADRGRPRRLSAEVAELLISIKAASPAFSVRAVIDEARRRGVPDDVHLASSTVHRLLAREGLLERDAARPAADRRRFAYRYAGELWMSDVMHGPAVPDGRRRRKTYLIAFIDDATRVVPHAAFAFSENTAAFLPVLRQALLRRGLPNRLYVDNGAGYRSRHLALVCAKLGIALIHAKPFQPAAKGKIERWFRTLREGWLGHLGPDALDGIETLNRRLWAWIEGEYHQAPHRGLDGETPLDRWAAAGADVRYADPGPVFDDVFLFEDRRRVMKDRTVSLKGRLYEVDAVLVGRTVVLRHDPAAPPGRPLQVVLDGEPAGEATVLDAYANTAVRRVRPSSHIETDDPAPEPPPSRIAMRDLDKANKDKANKDRGNN